MNEEFLKGIYDSKNLGANGATFEDFLKDMQDVNFARKIFDAKELGAQGATFDDFITDSGLKPPTPVQEHGGLYNLVGKIPVIGGAIQKGVDAISRGINQGASLSEGVNALTEGKGLDDEEVQAVSKILQQNKTEAEGDKSITAKFMRGENLSIGEWVGLAAETVVQSGAMMLRGAFDAVTNAKSAAMVAGGAGAGAAAGAPLFGIGALPGGIAGTMGAVSGLTEAAGMYFEELQKELDTRKLPINADNVRAVISDENWLNETRKRASIKGVVVGGIDAITGGLAAKIGKGIVPKLVEAGVEGRAARGIVTRQVAKGLATEVAGGAGGEALSQKALGDNLDVKSIALEGLGELLPGGISIYSGYIGSEGGKQIAEAKRIRTDADKTSTPITSDVKVNSERTSGIGHLIDAYKSNDLETAKTALADLAAIHSPEDFGGMLEVMAQVEGLSAEDVSRITVKFEEARLAAEKFNTPELQNDPITTSRAVKTRLDINQAEEVKTQLEEQKANADPSLHPQIDNKIYSIEELIAEREETLKAIVNKPVLEVSDSPEFFRQRLDELEVLKSGTRIASQEKTDELLNIGADLQERISSAISETYDDAAPVTPSQKVLYDGVEFEVTKVNNDGSFDLSTRDGRFVKAAEKTDTEWQGFVGQPETASTAKKEKKPSAISSLEKKLAAIKGSPIAQIESIGTLINSSSIPDFIYQKIGDGDISAGKALVQKAKDVHAEVKAFQSKLAGGKFFSDLDRQIAETRSRLESLTKPPQETPVEQQPLSDVSDEEYNAFIDTNTVSPERLNNIAQKVKAGNQQLTERETAVFAANTPAINDIIAKEFNASSQVSPDPATTNDGVNVSPANLAEESTTQPVEQLLEAEKKKIDDLAKEVRMSAKNAADLYLINRRIWGLNDEQAQATAVIQDRLVAEMARREGVSKAEMYKTFDFVKNPQVLPGNSLYQIIGESARLQRQVLTNLGLAQRAEKAGRPPSFIRQLSGWERGSDTKWRYELPDGNITITSEQLADLPKNSQGDSVTTLGEIYDGQELLNAYPQLRDVQVTFSKSIPTANAMYNDDGIHLSYNQVQWQERFPRLSPSLRSVLVHEIQHVIQDIEGFAQGGSPDMFSDMVANVVTEEDLANTMYRSLAGETEARNAQRRLNLTAEERRQTPLIDTEDVAREDQIVLFQRDDFVSSKPLLAPNGKPSNLNPEQHRIVRSPEFKRWFGDWENDPKNASKVVDENGEPLVVYHGTWADKTFTEFRKGDTYFSDNYATAKMFSINREGGVDVENIDIQGKPFVMEVTDTKGETTKMVIANTDMALIFSDLDYDVSPVGEWDKQGLDSFDAKSIEYHFGIPKSKIRSFKITEREVGVGFDELGVSLNFLNVRDPLIIDAEGDIWGQGKGSIQQDINNARGTRDGVIVRNLVEGGLTREDTKPTTTFVTFKPNQVKSAGGTNTTFDPNRNGFLFQNDQWGSARGAMAVQSDGIAVMYALTNPNVSTPVHELIHVFERYLTDTERTTVLQEAGHNEWTTDTSEFFARGFERYLLDGVSPANSGLQSTFEKFKKWLTDIYLGLKNSVLDTPISVRMENLYASFLSDEDFNNAVNQPRSVLNHRQIEELRSLLDQEELKKTGIPVEASIKDAIQNHISRPEDNHAKEIALALDAMNGLPLDAPRQLAIAHAIDQLQKARSVAQQQLKLAQAKKWGLGSDVGSLRNVVDSIEDDIDVLTRGLYRAGSTMGRALAVRKSILEFSKWEPAAVEEKLKDTLKDIKTAREFEKGVINDQDRQTIRTLTDKVKRIRAEIDELVIKDDSSATTAKRMVAQQEVKKPRGKSISSKISTSRSLKAAKAQLDNVLAGKIC